MRARRLAFLACAAALCCASVSSFGELSPRFEPLDLKTPIFDVNHVSLEPPVRARLATLLSAVVTNYDATLDAKLLGIALRLDPTNRDALAAAARRRKGDLPDERQDPPPYSTATVANYLAGQSLGLRTKGGPDNLALAGFLNDLAVGIDPTNEIALHEQALYRKVAAAPAWAFLPGQAAAEESAPSVLVKRQSKIRGLGITELASGEETGGVMEMIVTADDARTQQEVGVSVAQKIGDSMRTALDEAMRAVKLRHPRFGERQHLTLSFGEKYGAKDGPSAGAAFTLLLYSLYDPLQFASDAAITGDITVDGRVRKVGAVPSKIRAALLDGCRVVAIPRENAEAPGDTAILYAPNTLWKLQVFTVDTLDQAMDVMRRDRPAKLQMAMEMFTLVQKMAGLETPQLTRANAGLIPLLRQVLQLAPNHASAAYMLQALEGTAPASLSVGESLGTVQRITEATFRAAAPSQTRQTVDETALAGGLTRLEALRGRLDYRVADLYAADLAALEALQQLRPGASDPAQIADYRQRIQEVQQVEARMSNDRSLVEALRR